MEKPDWLKVKIPQGPATLKVREVLAKRNLHTVCEEARCPNRAECWGCGTATFLVLGSVCTRNCRFCAVATSRRGEPLDPDEPRQIAEAVRELGLKFAVLTSVDRDDLEDRGAAHFAACVDEIRRMTPSCGVEVLVPDYDGRELDPVAESKPDVIAHNVETIPRLQGLRDARSTWERSLATLTAAKHMTGAVIKTSFMLGLGETREELLSALETVRGTGCESLVLGQYLQPTKSQVPVAEYVHPDAFEEYSGMARRMGFVHVVSAPFARTSYHAERTMAAK